MLILIISVTILAAAIGGFLTYVGIDSVIRNKKEMVTEPVKTEPQGLYQVRAFPFVYKKEDAYESKNVLFAQILYPKCDEQQPIKKGGGNNEK